MNTESIIFTLLAAVVFGVLGYFISRSRSAKELASLQLQAEQHQTQVTGLQSQLSQSQLTLDQTKTELQATQTSLAVIHNDRNAARQRNEELTAELVTARSHVEERQQALSKAEQGLSEANARLKAEQTRSGELGLQITQLKQELTTQREKTEAAEAERNNLNKQLASIEAAREKEQKHFQEQLALLQENKEALTKEFKLIANEIMEAKGKAFSVQSTESLNAMLNPFKEQLESFRKRVDEVHTHQTEGQATLRAELTKLHELNQRITDEAANLTKALKGDKKKQGNWGELQVEMILDQSGLRKGIEYEREANLKDEDNNNLRPDFIVHLPEGKHVIIDSKVSLNAYNDYVSADTDEEREAFLKSHVQAVRKHIDDLFRKDYSKLQGINSPDFIFMFMPIEPAFITAFEYDQGLFNNAFEKHIVVVTPTTLLATLRTIANLWSIERQNQNARTLADQAGKVYDKLRVFVEKMEKLGNQLATAQKTYEEAHNTLTGSRSLTSTVQRFVDLGVRVKKELPAVVTESALLDDDTITSIEHLADADSDADFETESEEENA